MTNKKGLKRLIRRRVEETGERYTTARAMVLASVKRCVECGARYCESQQDWNYYDSPYHYKRGCGSYCLACWLGVGPKDFPYPTDEVHAPKAG